MISFVNPHIAPLLPLHVQRGCVQARVDATMVVCLEVCCLACISFRDVLPDAEGVELAVGLRLLRLALAAYPSSAFLAKVFRTAPVPADSSVAAAEPLTAKHVDQASLLRYVCYAVLYFCCVVLLLRCCSHGASPPTFVLSGVLFFSLPLLLSLLSPRAAGILVALLACQMPLCSSLP